MNDYIYYLIVDGEVLADKIFSTRSQAEQYATDNNIVEYSILQWDVD